MPEISPELVLIDPELGPEARARLSDRPWEDFLPPPRPPQLVAAPAPEGYRRRTVTVTLRIPVAATLWAVGMLAVLATLAFGLVPGGGQRPTLASTTQTVPQPPPPTTPSQARPEAVPGAFVTPGVTTAEPQAPPTSFKPARTFAWSDSLSASYYSVVFTRNGKKFYSATTDQPRIVLPANVRFTPGRYVWIVKPGFGERAAKSLGKPLLKSSFSVSR